MAVAEAQAEERLTNPLVQRIVTGEDGIDLDDEGNLRPSDRAASLSDLMVEILG
jgi:hypothetical protein